MKLNSLSPTSLTRYSALACCGLFSVNLALAAEGDSLLSWVQEGKANLVLNARYEYGSIDGFEDSNAITLKTLLGYTTATAAGFSAKVEFTDTHALDDDAYNAAGLNGQPTRTVVADPETTELNQLYLKYAVEQGSAVVGRQRYILDNARFIGNVGWRQNEQTFDAITAEFAPVEGAKLKVAYLDHINRIFADDRDWDSESWIINGSYAVSPKLSFTAYYYHLEFDTVGAAPTTGTIGGFVNGSFSASDSLAFTYRAETAYQEYDDADISTAYYHLNLGTEISGFKLGVGYEVLGSDDGRGQFQTPLATAHAYNGFADAYLDNGGAGGLEDLYFSVGGKFGKLALTGTYHFFDSVEGKAAEGTEFDVVAVYPIKPWLKALAKLAIYDGEVRADRERFIFQLTATY
jgi:hypothetical protein